MFLSLDYFEINEIEVCIMIYPYLTLTKVTPSVEISLAASQVTERVNTEFRHFLLRSYYGMLARIKIYYTVSYKMCSIRLRT